MSVSRLLPDETIRQVAAASDIAEVINASLPLRKASGTLSALCPFHDEKTPSFVVTPARQSFKCFGCGVGGDVIRFVMLRDGVGFPEAVQCLARRAGIAIAGSDASTDKSDDLRPKKLQAKPAAPPRPSTLPVDMKRLCHADAVAVAKRRGLSLAGVSLAAERGLLWSARSCGLPAWLIADAARINAQARRLDGKPFPAVGNLAERKAHTLAGSRAGWPVGTCEAATLPFVVLVEGGPDLLAAHHFIFAEGRESDVAAVAMLGAYNRIPEDALALLRGKRMRLFPHTDTMGQDSARRWAEQLEAVGCEVDAFRLDGLNRSDGQPVKDLNDLALLDADDFEREAEELREVLPR